MLTAATRANAGSEWYIKNFTGMVGAYRLDQKDWTEEEATAAGIYSDDIKPFTAKATLTTYQKYDIATVVDGRVVWPVLDMTAEEIAAYDKSVSVAALAACQCAVNGECMMMPVIDKLIDQGTLTLETLPAEFVSMYNQIKALQVEIADA